MENTRLMEDCVKENVLLEVMILPKFKESEMDIKDLGLLLGRFFYLVSPCMDYIHKFILATEPLRVTLEKSGLRDEQHDFKYLFTLDKIRHDKILKKDIYYIKDFYNLSFIAENIKDPEKRLEFIEDFVDKKAKTNDLIFLIFDTVEDNGTVTRRMLAYKDPTKE